MLSDIQQNAQTLYGNRIRIRVCGICIENDKVLLVKHVGLKGKTNFWSPPGGGVDLGETLEKCLEREFSEEVGLQIRVNQLLFINEFIEEPFHALEFFFAVERLSGETNIGSDPEMPINQQLIQNVVWLSLDEIKSLNLSEKHSFWQKINYFQNLLALLKQK